MMFIRLGVSLLLIIKWNDNKLYEPSYVADVKIGNVT